MEQRAQRRGLKRLLRYMPRRARLHRYRFIGRFAPSLRKRDYLWSLRRSHLRRAYYTGSIIALLPLFGLHLPLALAFALLFRANFMIVGGLQVIANPVTFAPVYYSTHQIGRAVIELVSPAPERRTEPTDEEIANAGDVVTQSLIEPLVGVQGAEQAERPAPVRRAVASLVLGGIVAGTFLGAALDLTDTLLRRRLPKKGTQRSRAGPKS